MKEVIVELTCKLSYAHKGDEIDAAKFITLLPPTSRHMDHVAYLKQCFYRAIPTDQTAQVESQDSGQKEQITGESILQIMMMSKNVDIRSVYGTAKELFCAGVALVDGQEKLTKPLCEEIALDDFEKMVGEYLVNFILASALQKMNMN